MKKISSVYCIKGLVLLRSAVLAVPTIVLAIFFGFMYSVAPESVGSSFLLSGFFLFAICIYIAMNIQSKEVRVQEELMLLHCQNKWKYYLSREMLIYSFALLYAIPLIVYPILCFTLNPDFFTRPMEKIDVLCGGGILLANGICGIAIGDFFHPRIITKRKNAILGAAFVVIISVCKNALIQEYQWLKFLNLLLPPVMDGFLMVGSTDRFDVNQSFVIILHAVLYSIVISSIKLCALINKKFG